MKAKALAPASRARSGSVGSASTRPSPSRSVTVPAMAKKSVKLRAGRSVSATWFGPGLTVAMSTPVVATSEVPEKVATPPSSVAFTGGRMVPEPVYTKVTPCPVRGWLVEPRTVTVTEAAVTPSRGSTEGVTVMVDVVALGPRASPPPEPPPEPPGAPSQRPASRQ